MRTGADQRAQVIRAGVAIKELGVSAIKLKSLVIKPRRDGGGPKDTWQINFSSRQPIQLS